MKKRNFVLNDHIVKVNYIKVKKEVPYLWKLRDLYDNNDVESKFKLEDYFINLQMTILLKMIGFT